MSFFCARSNVCEEDYTIYPLDSEDLDGRDFPWTPRVPMKKLRSGKEYPQLFTGTYTTSARLNANWSWETTNNVRHRGTQRYTNGDLFVGSFGNNLPSEGTYYFKNGDRIEGHFRNLKTTKSNKQLEREDLRLRGFDGMKSPYDEDETPGQLVSCPNHPTMGTFYNKKLNISFSGIWGISPAGAPSPAVCFLVLNSEVGGYIVIDDHEHLTQRAVYYRYGLFYENYLTWLHTEQYNRAWDCYVDDDDADDIDNYHEFPTSTELDLHPDSLEAAWFYSFKKKINRLI